MVLNWRHQSLLDPVNGVRQVNTSRGVVGVFIEIQRLSQTGRRAKTVETGSELGIGHVGKIVHPHSEGFATSQVLLVVLQNELKVVRKNAFSVGLFHRVAVVSAKLGLSCYTKSD